MSLQKAKLAQLKLMSASLKVRQGSTDPEILADALETTSDAIGEMAEFLDGLNLEHRNDRKFR